MTSGPPHCTGLLANDEEARFCLAPLRDHIGKPEYAECVRRILEALDERDQAIAAAGAANHATRPADAGGQA